MTTGRIEAARERVLSLKKTLTLVSAGVFALAVGVARATESRAAGSTQAARTHPQSSDSGYWDGGGASLGPAQSAPQAQTSAS